ncbi:hypothetical protein [Burkholderia diffusa]|uniref:hypothetical protein n=1 Tax=Burkholderia diffusa TaxID=488732 RepID=UPI001ABB954C|nr:hypothetical protein [Burkholderia diffusa]
MLADDVDGAVAEQQQALLRNRMAGRDGGFRPASASYKMPMICSSVNRFFIAIPLWNGLYTVTVLNAGSRSIAASTIK